MIAIVKSREEIEQVADHYNPDSDWILRGQAFPIEHLRLSGMKIDVEPINETNKFCYCAKIEGQWRFFSVDALKF